MEADWRRDCLVVEVIPVGKSGSRELWTGMGIATGEPLAFKKKPLSQKSSSASL